jgi:hypothetical protein
VFIISSGRKKKEKEPGPYLLILFGLAICCSHESGARIWGGPGRQQQQQSVHFPGKDNKSAYR